jgi:hypothetical protein
MHSAFIFLNLSVEKLQFLKICSEEVKLKKSQHWQGAPEFSLDHQSRKTNSRCTLPPFAPRMNLMNTFFANSLFSSACAAQAGLKPPNFHIFTLEKKQGTHYAAGVPSSD